MAEEDKSEETGTEEKPRKERPEYDEPMTIQQMQDKLRSFRTNYSIIADNPNMQNRIQALIDRLDVLSKYLKFVEIYFNEVDLDTQGEGMNLLRGNAYCDFIPVEYEYYTVRDLVWEYLDKIKLGLNVLSTIQDALRDLEDELDDLQDHFDDGDYGDEGEDVDEDKAIYYGTKDEVKWGNGTLYEKDTIKKVSDTNIIVSYRSNGIFVRVGGEIVWNILGGRPKEIYNGSKDAVLNETATLVEKEDIELVSETEFIIPKRGRFVGVKVGDEIIYDEVGGT